jgi:PKD repeat protein
MFKKILLKSAIALILSLCNMQAFSQMIGFTSNTNNGCAPLSVTFTNTTTDPNAYRYEWHFGDGSPMFADTTPTTVTHVYTAGGWYNPYVNVYNSTGGYLGNAYLNGSIMVNGASISAPDSACINDMVSFCSNGNNVNSVSWNFGDPASGANNTSTQFCEQHAFSGNGTYTVTLTTNSSCGITTATKTIVIAPNAYPHPSIMWNNSAVCPGQVVNFGTGGFATYSWNFNDPASGANNTSTLQNPQHAFSGIGTFTPTLTVVNGCNKTGIANTSVSVVTSPPFPNWFNLQANSPACPNSNISFNAPSGYNSYEWNFGDGSPVTTTTNYYNDHTYGSTPGTYPASVKITSPCGNDTTLYRSIVISNTAPFPPGMQFNTSSPACPGSYVNFEAPSGYQSYEWNFGDGSPVVTTTEQHNYHLYGNTLGNYTVTVNITNGCGNDTTLQSTVQIMNNVTFPSQSWFSVNVSANPACNGDQVNFYAPEGYPSYAWNFGDGNTQTTSNYYVSHVYSATGTYPVSVTITNNCGNTTTLNVSQVVNNSGSFPNWLDIDPSTNITCPNDIIEFSLNQSGYQSYSWNFGDGATATTTGDRIQHGYTTAGTYTVTCVVTNGCNNTATITEVIQVSASSPVASGLSIMSVQDPSCPGDEAFFTVHGGQSNYSYVWNYGDGSPLVTTIGSGSSHVYTSAGTYTVTNTVTNGCGSTLSVSTVQVISNSAIPSLRDDDGDRIWGFPGSGDHGNGPSNITAGCVGDAIVFYFEGAAANNVYNFGDGNTGTAVDQLLVYGGDGTIPVTIIKHAFSATGNYLISLTITNSCGNSVTDTMTIHIGGGLPVEGDMTTSPPPFTTCAPIDFLAFGGSDYEWNFGDGGTLSTSSSSVTHTYASAGVYVVSVEVTNGCGSTATFSRSLNVTGVGGPAITLSSSSSPTCENGTNGSATISVSNGQAPYAYVWSNGQSGTTASGLSEGLYYATVTDAIGCSSTLAVSVNDPAPIITNVTTTTTACGSSTGTATAAITSGGTGPYMYQWSTGITTATATGLAAGTYTVQITDANGCTSTANASISENGGAVLALNTVTNVTCNGGNNGSIDINVSGGSAPYTYLWSNSAAVQDPSSLTAGSYSLTVTDNNGCHSILNVTINQPSAINVTTSVVTSPTCGNFDGSAKATATGGSGPYTYLWDNNSGDQTTQTATNLPAGSYEVVVTDASGCTQTQVVNLSNSNAPNITAVISDVSCFGGSNGGVNVTVTGGTSPYLYTWSVPPPQTNLQDVTGLSAGSYFLFVNDAHGCMSFRNYVIEQPALLTATISTNGATCGNNDGSATAITNGGNTSFTYNWTPGSQTTQTATNLAIGSYTVMVTDNKGCMASTSTTITATTIPQEICMVTVDDASTHNIIYWEKSSATNIDSFRIYREDMTNVYTLIGAVDYDSLSEYHDYGSNPNTTTKRYKISAVDNCGGESELSNYHNTIYIVDNGSGQFTWNPLYTIENGANPVNNYILMRDDNNTGSWSQVATTAGTQNTLVDPSYSSYPNGKWYVETAWGISCTPTRATVNTTRSNIKNAGLSIGVNENFLLPVLIYPNPASESVTIEIPASENVITVQILNSIGQTVFVQNVNSSGSKAISQINTEGLAKGIYTISIKNGSAQTYKKLILN